MKNFLVNIKSFELHSVAEEEFLNKRLSKFTTLLIVQLISCQVAIVFSCGAPFFAKEPVLPYPAWYPLDWYNDRTSFWIVYFYQLVGILYEANAVVLLELFVIYLMIAVGAHIDILAMRLTKLGEPLEQGNDIPDSTYSALIDSIKVHNDILKSVLGLAKAINQTFYFHCRFQKSIEQSFSVPFFIQFIVSGLILCITSFQIATETEEIKADVSIVSSKKEKIKPAEDMVNLIFYKI
ncbi:Odorant receptor 59a, partial [Pseudolycoriella hygida]